MILSVNDNSAFISQYKIAVMRKTSSNFKIPVNSKPLSADPTRSHYDPHPFPPTLRNTCDPISQNRRKQSLPSSSKYDANLITQIKQALRTKQGLSSDNIDHRLSQAKRVMYQQTDPLRYTRKQNKSNNHQQREITFKDNLKEMQLEISSLKKLMEYEKARSHKMFEEKLFTVEEKFEEQRNFDDKIQVLKKLVEERDKGGRYVGREEYEGLREEVGKMRGVFVTLGEVDKRMGENLEIFKTFLLQNINTNILSTIDTRTKELNEMFIKLTGDIKEQSQELRELIDKSNSKLSEEITILKEECQTISESIVKEEILKFEESLEEWTAKLEGRMEGEVERLREEWRETIEGCQKRMVELENEIPCLNLQNESKIGMMREEISESMELVNGVMGILKDVVKKVETRGSGVEERIVELVRGNMRDVECVKRQIENIVEEIQYLGDRMEPVVKCIESNVVTTADLERSGDMMLIDDSFGK